MSIRLVIPGLSSPRRTSRPESVTALLTFLRIDVGLVEHVARSPARRRRSSTSSASGSWRSMIRAPTSGIAMLGHDEDLAEALVEAARDLPHQLDVLALVVADRHLVGAVGEHVGGLQHRVEEERRRDELALALAGLLLELGHAVEVAVGGDRGEQPGELGVLADVGLAEEDAALGVEPGGEQDRGRVVEALAQLGRVVGDRDRVQVDDAVDRRRRGPGPRRTGGSRRCSCRGACGRSAGCRRR